MPKLPTMTTRLSETCISFQQVQTTSLSSPKLQVLCLPTAPSDGQLYPDNSGLKPTKQRWWLPNTVRVLSATKLYEWLILCYMNFILMKHDFFFLIFCSHPQPSWPVAPPKSPTQGAQPAPPSHSLPGLPAAGPHCCQRAWSWML